MLAVSPDIYMADELAIETGLSVSSVVNKYSNNYRQI